MDLREAREKQLQKKATVERIITKLFQPMDKYLGRIRDTERAIKGGLVSGALTGLAFIGITAALYTCDRLERQDRETPRTEAVCTADVISRQVGQGEDVRVFNDYRPFGSLDEVVVVEDGEVRALRPSDENWQDYEQVWGRDVLPEYDGSAF